MAATGEGLAGDAAAFSDCHQVQATAAHVHASSRYDRREPSAMVRTSPDHTRPAQKTSHYLRHGAANSVRRAGAIPALDDGCLEVATRIETAATSKPTIAPHAFLICRGRDAPSIVGPGRGLVAGTHRLRSYNPLAP